MKTPIALSFAVVALCMASPLGLFEGHSGISETFNSGGVEFSDGQGEFAVTGAGGDIGGASDGFHYVWKKVNGDVMVNADLRFTGMGMSDHRRAAVMIRQSLDPRSAYVAGSVRGDGVTALQYRVDNGAAGKEVEVGKVGLDTRTYITLARRGNVFTLSAGKRGKIGGPLPTTDPVTVTMNGPVYVGLAVSSHDPGVQETAVFSNVMVQTP